MKIIIDENIIPRAKAILNDMHHEAILSKDVVGIGASDEMVFRFACENNYALITQNGKDFIIYIPPVSSLSEHPGLVWIKSEVTKKNCDLIISEIGKFLKEKTAINNMYFSVKYSKSDNQVKIVMRFPKTYRFAYQL